MGSLWFPNLGLIFHFLKKDQPRSSLKLQSAWQFSFSVLQVFEKVSENLVIPSVPPACGIKESIALLVLILRGQKNPRHEGIKFFLTPNFMVLHVLSTLSGIKCKRMLLRGQNFIFHSFSQCCLTIPSKIVLEAELLAMATFFC